MGAFSMRNIRDTAVLAVNSGRARKAGASYDRMRTILLGSSALIAASIATPALADDYYAATQAELITAIKAANLRAGADVIHITGNISISSLLPVITDSVTIDGGAHALDANHSTRLFFIDAGSKNVTISNFSAISNAKAQGGAGGGGGGGGLGAGGAIFVNAGNVSVDNVNFLGNEAIGGAGGSVNPSVGGGGGGGLGGSGGSGGQASGGGGGGFSGGGGGGGGDYEQNYAPIKGVDGSYSGYFNEYAYSTPSYAYQVPAGGGGAGAAGTAGTVAGGSGNVNGEGQGGFGTGGSGGAGHTQRSYTDIALYGGSVYYYSYTCNWIRTCYGSYYSNYYNGTESVVTQVAVGGGGGGGGGVGGGAGGGALWSNQAGGGGGGAGMGQGGTGAAVGGAGTDGGGGGGGSGFTGTGGAGGSLAGGGGAYGTAGRGGFGGGGGGSTTGTGGAGGFGGGAGSSAFATSGTAGAGAGAASNVAGGGGAGLGGAVFVRSGALTIGANVSTSGSTATGGSGANAGAGAASDLFLASGTTTTLAPGAGNTATFTGSIGDDSSRTLSAATGRGSGTGAGAAIAVTSGTVVFTGTNTYAGGTTIGGLGTLTGTTNGIQGTIINNGTVVIDQTFNGTYAGLMTGTGSLTVAGTGTITLSNVNNTYSGGTYLNGGLLHVTNDAVLGTGALYLNGGGLDLTGAQISANRQIVSLLTQDINVDSGTTYNLENPLSGAGTINFIGGGKLTLSQNNSAFTGDIYVAAGTLQVNHVNALGSSIIHMVDPTIQYSTTATYGNEIRLEVPAPASGDPSTFLVDAGVVATITGQMHQTGIGDTNQPVVVGGTGTLVLANATNSWTGTTTINSGATLQGTNASISGASIINDGRLIYDQNTNGTVAKDISGSGSLETSGTGAVTLTGTNSWTGTTTINAGSTLRGTSATIAGASIVNNGTLNYTAGGTVARAISGSGNLLFSSGSVTLTGANSWTGTTTITGDRLTGTASSIGGSSIVNNTSASGFGLVYTDSVAGVVSQSLSGTGTTSVAATGPLTFNGNITTQGTFLLNNSFGNVTLNGTRSGGTTAAIFGAGILNIGATGVVQGGNYHSISAINSLTVNNLGSISTTGSSASTDFPSSVGTGLGSAVSVTNQLTLTNGSATNSTASITGVVSGIYSSVTGSVAPNITNFGSIRGTGDSGIYATNGGAGTVRVTNRAGGTIEGSTNGILAAGAAILRVDNAGSIAGTVNDGVRGTGTGAVTVVNRAGGTITATGNNAASNAVYVNSGQALTVVNAGSISSTANAGVAGQGSAGLLIVRNANGATIQGGSSIYGQAVQLNSTSGSTFDNYGTALGGAGTPYAVNSQNNDYIVNLFAGSTTGNILLGTGADSVSLYTGVVGAAAVTTTDPIVGGAFTLRAAGNYGAAAFGTLNLGTGANTVALRGTGDGIASGAAGTFTLTGSAGLATVTKQDAGTWTITGNASGVGVTQINAGTGTPAGVLIFNNTSNLAAAINVNGAIIRATSAGGFGSGTITTVDPTIQYGATGTYTNNVVLASANTAGDPTRIQADAGVTATLTGLISQGSGTQPLVFDGAGTVVLTNGSNNYAGLTTISSGTVVERNTGTALGSGGVLTNAGAVLNFDATAGTIYTIEGGSYTGAGTIRFTSTNASAGFALGNAGNVTFSLASGGLIDIVSGTVGGSASAQGFWTGNLGDMTIAAGANFDTVEGTVQVDALNGAGILQGGFGGERTFTAGVDNGSGTFTGVIQNSPVGGGAPRILGFTKAGTGTQTLSGLNTYTGATTISGGTLALTGTGSILNSASVTNNANLDISGRVAGTTVNQLTGTGTVVLGANTLAANNASAGTISGAITGTTGGFTKTGAGNLTLSGANNYSGVTTISAGTLTGTTASISGSSIVNNATLAYVQAASGTAAQSISGTGVVNVSGLGAGNAVTFNGALTNAGGLRILDTSTATIGASGSVITGGTAILAANGARLNVLAGGVVRSTAATTIGAGTTFTIDNAGLIDGTSGNTIQTGTTALTLVNSGTVSSSNFVTVLAGANSQITNSGTISGGTDTSFGRAIEINGVGSVSNQTNGTLVGRAQGVYSGVNALMTITNAANARIVGATGGIESSGSVDITNAGIIAGGRLSGGTSGTLTVDGGRGVSVATGGIIRNNGGSILGGTGAGINSNGGTLTVNNTLAAGVVSGTVGLQSTGALTVTNYGAITGTTTGEAGINASNATTSITNYGAIQGGAQGIVLNAGGTVFNYTGASSIRATNTGALNDASGIYANGALALTNEGAISTASTGQSYGVQVLGRATVTNSGTITAANFAGLYFNGSASSISNSGTITGGTRASSGYGINAGVGATGTITNNASGLVTGTRGGIVRTGTGALAIINSGVISGTGTTSYGVNVTNGTGTITNNAGGIIAGRALGVISNVAATITNGGTIGAGTVSGGAFVANGDSDGLQLFDGGLITNNAGALLSAGASGIYSVGATITVNNSGTITGTGAGAYLRNGQVRVNNLTGGSIKSLDIASADAVVSNSGMIVNSAGAAIIGAGGLPLTVTNNAGGTISGSTYGIDLSGAGTIVNSGSISGTTAAIRGASGNFANSVTLNSGTVTGAIDLGGGNDILNFNGGTFSSTIDGGTGTDAFNSNLGALNSATIDFGNILNFESVTHQSGTLTLTGTSSYAGPTSVAGGTLVVNGSTASATTVANGATLAGLGSINAAVTIANGGTLIGAQGSTLTMGSLGLSSGAIINASFNAPGGTALFGVTGNLTLDGTLNVTNSGAGVFGAGIYRLISYGGTLTDNGLVIGTAPSSSNIGSYAIQTASAGQVNLVAVSSELLFWDGGNAALSNNSQIDGGSGTWSATAPNWTDSTGAANGPMTPQPGFAVFQSAPGTVTVDIGAGAVGVTGMQFAVDGYRIEGDPLTLANAATLIRVGDGTAPGAGYTATIASELTGTGGLAKNDLGTLILTGNNSYTGATALDVGVLRIGDGIAAAGILGSITLAGDVTLDLRQNATIGGQILSGGTGTNVVTIAGTVSGNYDASGTGIDNVTLAATGVMAGANLGGGDDSFLYQGGSFSGLIDGSAGTDAFTATIGAGNSATINQGNVAGFESQSLTSGTLTLVGTASGQPGWSIAGDTVLNIGDGTTAGDVSTAGNSVTVTGANATVNIAAGSSASSTGGYVVASNQANTVVNNTGTIAASFDNAIQLGAGGIVTNSGSITGGSDAAGGYGIYVAAGDATITNQANGIIAGGSGQGAISLNGAGAVTLDLQANSTVTGVVRAASTGTRTVMVAGTLDGNYDATGNSGVDTITMLAGGSMTSANLGAGDDVFTYYGGTISGIIDGDADTDTLNADFGAGNSGTVTLANFINFERFTSTSGNLNLTGPSASPDAEIYSNSGTTSFTNTESNTGDIYINGGDIRANTAGAFGTGTIHFIDPTAFFGATGTYANNISLEVQAPATANPSTLSPDAGVVATLTGTITQGTGVGVDPNQPLVIAGQGTIILTNTGNLWSGTTTVNAGATLQGSSSSISGGNIVANGTLAYVQPTSGTVSQNITGTGAVRISGVVAGQTLTFAGTSGVSGGFTVLDASAIANTGTITGQTTIAGGGSLANQGALGFVTVTGAQASTITNNGGINNGVFNSGALALTNASSGTIGNGISATGAATSTTIVNAGSVTSGATAISVSAGALDVTNAAGGSITATGGNGIFSSSAGAVSINNSGTIAGNATYTGVFLNNAAGSLTLTNNAGGVITGYEAVRFLTGTLNNAGTLNGLTNNAITALGSATVNNLAGGVINATAIGGWGIDGQGATLVATNAGTINAESGVVKVGGTGTFANSGTINASLNGVLTVNAGMLAVTNSGTIASSDAGVRFAAGGSVANNAGSIAGTNSGIVSTGGALSIVNNALLSGSTSAIVSTGAFADTVLLNAGSTTNGAISLGDGVDQLTLAGALTGNLDLGAGDDVLTLIAGGTTNGTLDGGVGTDSLALAGAVNASLDAGTVSNFEAGLMNGTGVWTLTGTDTSAIGWQINSGTLAASGGTAINDAATVTIAVPGTLRLESSERIASLNGVGAVALGANTLTLSNGGAYAGVIGGAGNLALAGGALTLSGANTYTGATSINAGTLTLGASNVLADATAVAVATGATMDLGTSSDTVATLALNGTLSGTGTLTAASYALNGATVNANLGAGSLTNAGTSTLNGTSAATAVNVQGGTLTLGASERLANGAALAVNTGATFNLAGFTETVGSLTNGGSGGGTLALGAGRLVLAGNGDYGFSGQITGGGSIDHTGTGRLTLAGNFAATGRIDASAGTLAFSGTSQGSARVQGGTLIGNGTFAGNLGMTSGTLSPGGLIVNNAVQPIGSLQAQSLNVSGGNLAFDFGGANLAFASDTIRVTGPAVLTGGTVNVNSLSATSQYNFNNQYLVVQAGSLTGTFANGTTFASVASDPTLQWRLRYDLVANSVVLQVQKNVDFSAGVIGGSANQQAIGAALTGGAGMASDQWSASLNSIAALSIGQRAAAYNSLSGEVNADASTSAILANNLFLDTLRQRMGNGDDKLSGTGFSQSSLGGARVATRNANSVASRLSAGQGDGGEGSSGGLWSQAYGGYQRLLGEPGQATLETSAAGVAMGGEGRIGDLVLGVAGGLTEIGADVDARSSNLDGRLYQAGGYASYDDGVSFVSLSGNYYSGRFKTLRIINIGGATQPARARFESDGYALSIAGGTRVDLGNGLRAVVSASATKTRDSQDGFTENAGGGLGLTVAAADRDLFTATGDIKLGQWIKTGAGYAMPYVNVGVRYNAGDLDTIGNMRFSGAPAGTGTFQIQGARIEQLVGTFGAGVDVRASDHVSLGVAVENAYGSRTREGRASMRVKIAF
ncbi:MAG: autotransporter-associated beta strand repeat-containing protein [Pseudomonadota bacterium]